MSPAKGRGFKSLRARYKRLPFLTSQSHGQKMIKESEEFTLSVKHFQEDWGMEIWFDWPKNETRIETGLSFF